MNSQMYLGKTAAFTRGKTIIEGEVVGETKNTFKVRSGLDVKTLIKSNYSVNCDSLIVNGALLARKPEDRIKGAR